jgi:hypothetical protein
MTRSLACFSASLSVWLAMAGTAAGVGKSISGLSGALDKAFKAGQPVSDEQPAAATTAKPAAKTPSTSATATPTAAPTWEDPGGVEPGLGYAELLRRFGPPAMAITGSAEGSLTYRGKDGMFQVKVRDGVVASIDKPRP